MPHKTCLGCGLNRYTCKVAVECVKCRTSRLRREQDVQYYARLDELGYDVVDGYPPQTVLKSGNKRQVIVTNRECGHTFSAQLENILNKRTICGVCGKTKRMAHAMKFYVAKFGRTYDVKKWTGYKALCWEVTNKNWRKHKATLNPLNHPRGTPNSHPNAVNLDHIVPMIYGFKNGLTPEQIGDIRNLQIIPARVNLSKKSTLTDDGRKVLKFLLSIEEASC